MSKNIIFNYSLESYKKKYRNNRYKLLSFSKKEIEDFNKKKNNKNVDFLLKSRKWALIGDTYYEIPKAPRWTWFRNLNAGVQATVISLGSVGLVSAAVFPTLFATIWKPITAGISEKLKEDVEIETKEKLVVGEAATIELTIKDKSKDTKQLPSDPEKITVTTGGVKLDYWQKPTTVTNTISNSKCTSYADSIVNDDPSVEPENYYSYYYSKDKADLYIKKVLGPIVVDMVLEDRSYTVTFNPKNEVDKSTSIEVLKGAKIKDSQKPTIEDNEYREFDNWYATGSSEAFDFNKEIYADVTLNAKYNEGSKSGVFIKGLTNLNDYNTSSDAYTKGKAIVDNFKNMTEEEIEAALNDTQVINGRKVANITWYIFGDVTIDNSSNYYYLSFGKTDKKINNNWDFYNTSVIGVTKNAKASFARRTITMGNENEDTLENPTNFKDVEIDITGTDFVLNCQDKGTHYVLNIDNCKFDRELEVWESEIMTVSVTNCIFQNRVKTKYGIEFVREDQENDVTQKPIEDVIVFRNNTVIGDTVTRGININDPYCKKAYIENNTFKNIHTDSSIEDSIGTAVIQLSCGYDFEVNNNTITNCKCNAFKLHEGLKTYNGVKIAINNNKIDSSYLGVNETGRTDFYTLSSTGNEISSTTSTTKCYFDNTLHENDEFVFHLN